MFFFFGGGCIIFVNPIVPATSGWLYIYTHNMNVPMIFSWHFHGIPMTFAWQHPKRRFFKGWVSAWPNETLVVISSGQGRQLHPGPARLRWGCQECRHSGGPFPKGGCVLFCFFFSDTKLSNYRSKLCCNWIALIIYIHCIFTVLNIHVTVSLRLHIARLFGIQVINESGSTIIC